MRTNGTGTSLYYQDLWPGLCLTHSMSPSPHGTTLSLKTSCNRDDSGHPISVIDHSALSAVATRHAAELLTGASPLRSVFTKQAM